MLCYVMLCYVSIILFSIILYSTVNVIMKQVGAAYGLPRYPIKLDKICPVSIWEILLRIAFKCLITS